MTAPEIKNTNFLERIKKQIANLPPLEQNVILTLLTKYISCFVDTKKTTVLYSLNLSFVKKHYLYSFLSK